MKKYEKWHIIFILIGLVALIAGPYLVYFVQHMPPPRSEWWHLYVDMEHNTEGFHIYDSMRHSNGTPFYGVEMSKTGIEYGEWGKDYYRYESLENGSKVHLGLPEGIGEYVIQNGGQVSTYTFVTPYGRISFSGKGFWQIKVNCKESYVKLYTWPEDQEKTVSVAFSTQKEGGNSYYFEGTAKGLAKVGLNQTLENGEYQVKGLLFQGLKATASWMIQEDGTRVDNVEVVTFDSLKRAVTVSPSP